MKRKQCGPQIRESETFEMQAGDPDFFTLVRLGTPTEIQAAIDRGADVRAADEADYDATPLYLAAANNENPEVIAVLVGGADIEARNCLRVRP